MLDALAMMAIEENEAGETVNLWDVADDEDIDLTVPGHIGATQDERS